MEMYPLLKLCTNYRIHPVPRANRQPIAIVDHLLRQNTMSPGNNAVVFGSEDMLQAEYCFFNQASAFNSGEMALRKADLEYSGRAPTRMKDFRSRSAGDTGANVASTKSFPPLNSIMF